VLAIKPNTDEKQKKLIHRLNRVGGQIKAVRAMIEQEKDCTEIAQQLAAARAALDKTYFEMMACAIERGIDDKVQTGESWKNELQELTRTLTKYA